MENVRKVQTLLKYTFTLVPIVAGIDKYLNLLTDWGQYISDGMANLIPFQTDTFMYIVGIVEIVAGVLVFLKPKIGSLVVSGWLLLIALTLILSGQYLDVAVRDIVMAIAAFGLYLLSDSSLLPRKVV